MLMSEHPLLSAVALAAVVSLPTVAATKECPTQDLDKAIPLLEGRPHAPKR